MAEDFFLLQDDPSHTMSVIHHLVLLQGRYQDELLQSDL